MSRQLRSWLASSFRLGSAPELPPQPGDTEPRPNSSLFPAVSSLPLIVSVYVGVAEAAARSAIELSARRKDDPSLPYLLGEMHNLLTTAQIALGDMLRMTGEYTFAPSLEIANGILTRKSIAAKAVLATVEKAMEATGGGGFYRKTGLERLLRDAHAGQFHPLPEKRQQRLSGRIALGLAPIG